MNRRPPTTIILTDVDLVAASQVSSLSPDAAFASFWTRRQTLAYRARCVDCGANVSVAGPAGLVLRHARGTGEPIWFCMDDAGCAERCWLRYGGAIRATCEARECEAQMAQTAQMAQGQHGPLRWRVVATDGRTFVDWLYRQVERADAEKLAAMLNRQQSGVTYFVEADDDEDA